MSRMLVLIFVAATVAVAAWSLARGGAGEPQATLGGTVGVVDAAGFPTLQAALDAVPREGGIVRLPPGTFEISEPLRIRGDHVCLQGSGTATHIKNVNAAGQPALVLRTPTTSLPATTASTSCGACAWPISASPATRTAAPESWRTTSTRSSSTA